MKSLDYTARNWLGESLHTAETLARGDGGDSLELTVDAAVVGAGPAGLVSACILADAGLDVVVLEAGQFWRSGDYQRDQTWATQHLYQEGGTRICKGNALIPLASGKGVGGGTLVNSGISFRAPDRILDRWYDEFGVDIWRPERRDAIYREVEKAIGVSPTSPDVAGGNTRVAKRGFEGMDVEHDYMPRNTPGCAGCGTCQTGCPVGGKASADLNWLPRLLREGGDVYADTRVDDVLTEKGRVVGVRGATTRPDDGKAVMTIEVRADRTLLACGAVHTPMMMQRNDLATNEHVGRNLHIHPGNSVVAHMPEDVLIWQGATQGYYAKHPDEPDIVAETFSAPPEALYTPGADVGYAGMDFIRKLRRLAGCGTMIRDTSSGTVEPGSRGWKADISYRVEDRDIAKLRRAYQFVVEMFFEAGAEEVKPLFNGADFWSSRNRVRTAILDANVGDMMLYASHPTGTCRMSADASLGVVRPSDGRVHDVPGLHVVDSSVLPTAPGVNPQMTIMGTALELARGIVDAA